jgi:ribosomal protein L7/L12
MPWPANIPPGVKAEIILLVRQEHKIQAIKTYRNWCGDGLKECKDFIEDMEDEILGKAVPSNFLDWPEQ